MTTPDFYWALLGVWSLVWLGIMLLRHREHKRRVAEMHQEFTEMIERIEQAQRERQNDDSA